MALPLLELGFPGTTLRERLVAAVLDGTKTTTTGLLADHEMGGEPLPVAGDRYSLAGTDGSPVAEIELVEIRVVAMADVDLQHVLDEGEGDDSVEAWRRGHTAFFESDDVRTELGDPGFTVDDDTMLVLQRFRVVDDR